MRKFVAGFVGLAALIASPALAADLPVGVYKSAPPSEVVPPFSWTGCFIGGFGGGTFAHKNWTLQPPGANISLGSHDADSWLAGGQAGCDYQFNSWLVIGGQGDFGFADARGNHPDLLGNTAYSRTKSVYSATGRIGLAYDHWLFYGRGGGAWAHDYYSRLPTGTPATLDSATETRTGWTGGAGAEYAVNKWMSVFAEYDYYDFGTRTLPFVTPAGAFSANIAIQQTMHVGKVGMNVRWGGW